MAQIVNKKVNLRLVGLDGNTFSLLGAFQHQAKKEKWTEPEIKSVLDAAMSGDYGNLLVVLDEHCEPPEGHEEDDDE